jgi:hypothetical protein
MMTMSIPKCLVASLLLAAQWVLRLPIVVKP